MMETVRRKDEACPGRPKLLRSHHAMTQPPDTLARPSSGLRWNLTASHTLERLVRIAFFVAGCEAGVWWRLQVVGAGPEGIVSLALFSPVILAAAIGLAALGASGLLRLTRAAGWHGTITMEMGRLAVAGKAAFDLSGTLVIDGWQATSRLGGRLRMPFLDSFRSVLQSKDGGQRWTWASVAQFTQSGCLAAVCASLPAGRRSNPGPAGLQLPVGQPAKPTGPCVRLAPGELVELVAAVRAAVGRPMPAEATPSPVVTTGRDPRSLFRSWPWVLGVSAALILLACVPPAIRIVNFEPKPVDAEAATAAEVAHQVRMLRSSNSLERQIAARELAMLGRKAAPALESLRKTAAEDKDPAVREVGAETVKSIEQAMAKP